MEWDDAESLAEGLHLHAKFKPEDPPGAPALAQAIFGFGAIREASTWSLPGRAVFVAVPRPLILVRPRLRPDALNEAVAHELAERELTAARYQGSDRERLADYLAGCITAPGCAVRERFHRHGWRLGRLARMFCLPRLTVALRIAEVTGAGVALVAMGGIIRRGNDLPTDRFLQWIARKGGDSRYGYRVLPVEGLPGARLVVKTGR